MADTPHERRVIEREVWQPSEEPRKVPRRWSMEWTDGRIVINGSYGHDGAWAPVEMTGNDVSQFIADLQRLVAR